MLSRWPIRYKLWIGFVTLCCIMAVLAFVGFRGVYSFRQLTKSIKARSNELPLAADLTQRVANLRVVLSRRPHANDHGVRSAEFAYNDGFTWRQEFSSQLMAVRGALEQYKAELENFQSGDAKLVENARERETVRKIEVTLAAIEHLFDTHDWILEKQEPEELNERIAELQTLTGRLPGFMKQGMDDFAIDARLQYRAWIGLVWLSTIFAAILLLALVRQFYSWIFQPLKILIEASRRVAKGDFEHRVHLDTHDEMSELAGAMNAMTNRFQEVRDDLDRQVKLRTKEVVRSEQLASVGFLAAGVAHEINNPLASVAWAAESLESRVFELLHDEDAEDQQDNEEIEVLQTYLRRIQDEAFRCKGITERLLDYSRMGDVEKQNTNMPELAEGVIDMVRHLGKYREKQIEFKCDQPVIAPVNPQEIKQVILNLLTNGLDSLDPGGKITVEVGKDGNQAEVLVTDDGCGMTEEVMEHLFEPFFTRRRDGQGTGLGLSITYRIIADHGGTIEVFSDGPGKGSQFRVRLPLVKNEEKQQEQLQAA